MWWFAACCACPPCWATSLSGWSLGPTRFCPGQRFRAGVRYLAEFGVVFLMFVIGLEFNLPKLKSMKSLVFGRLQPGGPDHARHPGGSPGPGLPDGAVRSPWRPAGLGHQLAKCGRSGRRAGHEFHGHCGQAHVGTAGAGIGTRPPRHGHLAVSRFGRGAAAGADSRPGRQRQRTHPNLGHCRLESRRVADGAPGRWSEADAHVVHRGGPAQRARSCSCSTCCLSPWAWPP